MVTPSDLEKRNSFLLELGSYIEKKEKDFEEILGCCGWSRQVCDKCRNDHLTLDCACVKLHPIPSTSTDSKEDVIANSDFFYKNTTVVKVNPATVGRSANATPQERLQEYDRVIQSTRGKRPRPPSSIEHVLTIDFSRPTKVEKTKEELLIEESRKKRRRPTYTGKTHTRSKNYNEVLRGMIGNINEFLKATNRNDEASAARPGLAD